MRDEVKIKMIHEFSGRKCLKPQYGRRVEGVDTYQYQACEVKEGCDKKAFLSSIEFDVTSRVFLESHWLCTLV